MEITFLGNFTVDYTSETHHANTLESLGHTVKRLQEGKATGQEVYSHAKTSQLLVVVHTHGWKTPGVPIDMVMQELRDIGVPTITYHLDLWFGLQRQHDLENDPFYTSLDYFFCTDKLMADWFNKNTRVKGVYIPAGVYEPEAYLDDVYNGVDTEFVHDIVFTGSRGYHPEWPYRPTLIDWLKNTYGDRFAHYGNDGVKVVRGAALNKLYAQSKIVIGDTLCLNYDYPYYFSDRLFETTGRGAFVIFPYIIGLEYNFTLDKELIDYNFNDFNELKTKIDYYLSHDIQRETIRLAGHERAKKDHTYTTRWSTILEHVKNGKDTH